MAVIMQAFYWDCPSVSGRPGKWWDHVREHLESLSKIGVDRIWLPPAQKSFYWDHMGYDPFDYYDLGEFDQKGNRHTGFGAREDLVRLIQEAHSSGIQVLADLVLNHNSGGESEYNPILSEREGKACRTWTRFDPASGKFPRNYEHFHPSLYSDKDAGSFGEMPDLCHFHPYVYAQLMQYAKWLCEEIGFDGFRYDCVKCINAWMIVALQNYLRRFAIGEYWDNEYNIERWLERVEYRCSAFDFPLRETLRKVCEDDGFSLTSLDSFLVSNHPFHTVTFVENHDTDVHAPIVRNKLLAYSYLLTHEGYPCVFWKDFYEYELGKEGTPTGLARLMSIHDQHSRGCTTRLYADDTLYIMQREGEEEEGGLVYVLNTSEEWKGIFVNVKWHDRLLFPYAWNGEDKAKPGHRKSNGNGRVELWAAPKGYAIYVPQPESV